MIIAAFQIVQEQSILISDVLVSKLLKSLWFFPEKFWHYILGE